MLEGGIFFQYLTVPEIGGSEFPYGDSVIFEIRHVAITCESTFTVQASNLLGIQSIYESGFLNGDFTEQANYHIIPSCFVLQPVDICQGYKTKSIGLLVRVPTEFDAVIVKETCCYKLPVFAEQTEKTENWKNDFKSFPMQKKQTKNDTFVFTLIACGEEIIC